MAILSSDCRASFSFPHFLPPPNVISGVVFMLCASVSVYILVSLLSNAGEIIVYYDEMLPNRRSQPFTTERDKANMLIDMH